MNDPNKRIDVNLSSLLSLKAELLRKKAEVNVVRSTQVPADEYIAKKKHSTTNNNSSENCDVQKSTDKSKKTQSSKMLSKDDNATVYECEDTALLEKSRRVLEAKSKFYARMSRTGGKLNSDDNCLVQFNRKRQEEGNGNDEPHNSPTRRLSSSTELSSSSDSGTENDDDDDWVEFTDCLGRTRKCLRKDLEENKRRDAELAAAMPERLDQSKANWMLDTHVARPQDDNDIPIGPMPPSSVMGDSCSFMSKLDEQKSNWERKEGENLEKTDIHYQDVFFDEARQHGVGYYAFSTDEEERRKQQRELEAARQRTINEQKHRDNLRAQREKIIAQRVLAAKNRQRARQGLPPLEEKDLVAEKQSSEEMENKEQRRERKRAEKKRRKLEELEREREEERQRHVRPWDKNKNIAEGGKRDFDADEDVNKEWHYKPERLPMSQEEWNEQQRAVRVTEFGPMPEEPTPPPPPSPPKVKRTNFTSVPPPPAQRNYNNYNMVPPPVPPPRESTAGGSSWANELPDNGFAIFQSSKKQERKFQRRNYESNEAEAVPATEQYSRGVAIPPPENLDADFTLPPHAKRARPESELERSIEAGLKFLRENCDKGTMSTKSTWTAKADY